MRMRAGLFLVLTLVGCGKPQASFEDNVFRRGPIAFQLPSVPAGWKRVQVDESALAFRDDRHEASVLVNARCLTADDRTPLVALTNHLLIGATEREYLSQGVEPFDGREALHTKVKAKWDGVPLAADLFVLSKDGCIYDFVYLGPQTGFEQFEGFVRGFKTLPGSGVVAKS